MSADMIDLANKQRAALERAGGQVTTRLIAAYAALWRRLADKAELLGHDIAALEHPTADQVMLLARYGELMGQVATELGRYAAFVSVELDANALAAIVQAGKDASQLVAAAGVTEGFTVLPTDTVRAALAFLDPNGPLYQRLAQLAPTTTQAVADTIVEKVAMGLNPRAWAGVIRDELGGGLTDAMRMARTVQLYSYREASRANYAANPNVVSGWYWFAQLDADTCLSCVAQHGSFHTTAETLNDHHNGRCAMIPAVVGAANPITASGQEWFGQLPAGQQAAMMGPGKFQGWKSGQFEFSALSGMRVDPVYGPMRVEETLQSLVGA